MTARSLTASRSALPDVLGFALPIGLSAFLLFSVQPLVGRIVLPVFGGTPAVWATSLFFFQAVLLIGYMYGHLSVTRFGAWGPPLHLVLAGLAVVALVLAPATIGELRDPALDPALDVIKILVILIGLPSLILTTTTPLVSGWFGASSRGTGNDPYWLYALSNGGSLLALIAYPLVIEPRIGLYDQRAYWAVGYGALVLLIGLAAARVVPVLRALGGPGPGHAKPAAAARTPKSLVAERARWLLLAAIPSGLLSAVTTFIATDLVSAPLLWVAPLAIYLMSFVIAFSPRGGRWIRRAAVTAPAMVTLLWVPYGSAGGWPVLIILAMELVAFGVVATAIHGRLAEHRPDPSRLTEFYLILALGGALASAFVALFAPVIFPGVWEYPILLVGALVALALVSPQVASATRSHRGLDFSGFLNGFQARFAPYLVASIVMSVGLVATGAQAAEAGMRWLLVGGMILAVGARPWFLALATAFVLALATFALQPQVEFRDRSFFGVTEVLGSGDGQLTILMNGTTLHGAQATEAGRARKPQSYYVEAGPAGDLFRIPEPGGGRQRVAVAGLGAGTLATYADAQTDMTFFEIDPVVIRVASDPRYFTYLEDAVSSPVVVEGDARLSFRNEPDGRYDLLILDAFSSDSVPVHLLTAEAIADEVRLIKAHGLLAFHISNRYYDLAPPIAAAVTSEGLTMLEKLHSPGAIREPGELPSRWLVASRDREALEKLRAVGWSAVRPADRPFSDDYSDLLRYLNLEGFR